MFAPLRSPTMTDTTKKIYATKKYNPPPFLIFRILRQTSWCHISQVGPLAYASWHMLHPRPCTRQCADWCYNFPKLSVHSPSQDPSQSVHVGPLARGEGVSAFPLISPPV